MGEPKNTTGLENSNFLFRFRSAEALLNDDPANGGFEEIERQTIYFAQPETLNDPMEGITDAFWDGDAVLWENLFRHYALSLLWYTSGWLVFDAEEISEAKVGAALTTESLPTDAVRDHYHEFVSGFCSEIRSKELAGVLGQRTVPLRRERLVSLLSLVHGSALHHLFKVLHRHGMYPSELPTHVVPADQVRLFVDAWEALVREPPTEEMPVEHVLEIVGRTMNRVNHQLELGMLSRADDKDRARKWIALLARFPDAYVDAFLSDLHFPPWRVACFSRRCVNASMWGTYGHEHRGAALVFRTHQYDEKRFFRLQGMAGQGSQGHELEVRPVRYRDRPPPLDSFLEIGVLPRAKLEATWMKSEAGVPSTRLAEIADTDAWRKAHWKKAFERATWKHPDWKHEDELRLIVSSVFRGDPAPAPLTYDFQQLEGIVFGMRMKTEDKLRIAQVVEKKCRTEGRSDFRFFQAHYSAQRGEMEVDELTLLEFKV
ncbi:MAG: DUF2971 domain-containing protein [Myxococcales bacterium]|nr:DUF2971 domain-containing protein [Myxococcales bacterium]